MREREREIEIEIEIERERERQRDRERSMASKISSRDMRNVWHMCFNLTYIFRISSLMYNMWEIYF